VKLHGGSFEHIHVFNHNFIYFFEFSGVKRVLFLFLFKNKQLIEFLLASNQLLACDDGDIFLILAFLNSKNFIGFPSILILKKNYGQLAKLLSQILPGSIHNNFINLGAEEHLVLR